MKVNMQTVNDTIDELMALVETLDGIDPNQEQPNNKVKMATKAQQSADLLYAAHLAKRLEMQILDQYHAWKGRS